jgi:hypothetical protein
MAVSDAEFDAALDWVVQSTVRVVNNKSGTEYFTTLFLLHEDEIAMEALVCAEGSEASDPYDVFYDFGKHFGQNRDLPDAVFVAAESTDAAGNEFITVTGYTPDGRANLAELHVEAPEEIRHASFGGLGVSLSRRRRAALAP